MIQWGDAKEWRTRGLHLNSKLYDFAGDVAGLVTPNSTVAALCHGVRSVFWIGLQNPRRFEAMIKLRG